MDELAGSRVSPVDGDDSENIVTITKEQTGEVARFPRLWQVPEGVIDLSDTLQGVINQREGVRRQWAQVGTYDGEQEACAHGMRGKLEALVAALQAHDIDQALAALNSVMSAEFTDMDEVQGEMQGELLDEHPELTLASDSDDAKRARTRAQRALLHWFRWLMTQVCKERGLGTYDLTRGDRHDL